MKAWELASEAPRDSDAEQIAIVTLSVDQVAGV
jgi:hypothetical protein